MVINPLTMAQFYALLASNTAVTLPDYFMMNSRRAHDDEQHAACGQQSLKCHCLPDRPGVMYNGIGKVWGGGIQVIRDEYTKAAENQLLITANVYMDFDVVRPAGYRHVEFLSP